MPQAAARPGLRQVAAPGLLQHYDSPNAAPLNLQKKP